MAQSAGAVGYTDYIYTEAMNYPTSVMTLNIIVRLL